MARVPPRIELMFSSGTSYRWPDGTTSVVDVVSAGEVSLPSGRLVVRDPENWVADPTGAMEALADEVAPGRYAVTLSIAHWDQPPRPNVPPPMRTAAAARVAISDADVFSWELALRRGQDMIQLEDDEIFGFGVDSGQGCFLDASCLPLLKELQDQRSQLDDLTDTVMRRGFATIDDLHTDLNIVIFECGMGDGFYPVWLGHGIKGEIVSIVADLEVFDHSLGPVNASDQM